MQSDRNTPDGPQTDRLPVGTLVDGTYKVMSAVGKGGMGAVYRVEHIYMQKQYAMKVLNLRVSTESNAIRFHMEAKLLGSLQHPNIVRAYNIGLLENGDPYYIMDLLDGESLLKHVNAQGPLALPDTVQLMLPICGALQYAHEKGVVHRDLKPENIILSFSDEGETIPLLIDFGIARLIESADGFDITRTGEVFGTPYYMSPEQCQGQQADRGSDIYSLGCVLFFALTGRAPFLSDSGVSIMLQHKSATPPSIKEASGINQFPESIEAVVRKCLAKEPSRRYQSCDELEQDLMHVLEESESQGSVSDRPMHVVPPAVLPQPGDLKPAPYLVLAAAVVVVFAGLTITWFCLQGSNQSRGKGINAATQNQAAKYNSYKEAGTIGIVERQLSKHPTKLDIEGGQFLDPQELKILSRYPQVAEIRLPGATVDDDDLVYINPAAVATLDLDYTRVKTLRCLAAMKNLSELDLSGTDISDQSLQNITGLSHLTSLSIQDTNVGDKGAEYLCRIKSLQSLSVRNTHISPEYVARLRRALPTCIMQLPNGLSIIPGSKPARADALETARLKADASTNPSPNNSAHAANDLRTIDLPEESWFGEIGYADRLFKTPENYRNARGQIRVPKNAYVFFRFKTRQAVNPGSDEVFSALRKADINCIWLEVNNSARVFSDESDPSMRSALQRIAQFKGLERIEIQGMEMGRAEFPVLNLDGMRKLQDLSIVESRVDGGALAKESVLRRLQSLELDSVVNAGAVLRALRNSGITGLSLQKSGVSDENLNEIATMKKLVWLRLTGNKLVSDRGIEKLKGLPRLEVLYLDNCSVSDRGAQKLRSALHLSLLQIH